MLTKRLPTDDLSAAIERCQPIWQQLAGCRLLITGGTGFFGAWILEVIAAANATRGVGIRASIVSRNPDAYLARLPHLAELPEFEWLPGTAMDFAYRRQAHDYLLHLATLTSAANAVISPSALVNKLAGIHHVIDVARRLGIRRGLVTSSGAVYGQQPVDLDGMPETYRGAPDPLQAASAYGNGKRLVEQYCALVEDIDLVVARCFSFVGPYLPLHGRFAIGNFIADGIAGQPITVQGDGTAIRSYLYASDLAVWLLTLLVGGEARTAYNVGSDQAISIGDLAQRVALLSRTSEVRILHALPTTSGNRYVPSIERARRRIGLDVFTDLDMAIVKTLDWYSLHGSSDLQDSRRMAGMPQ